MIVRTSSGRTYSVVETMNPDLNHVWYGIAVKRAKGYWTRVKNDKIELVRKAASELIEA